MASKSLKLQHVTIGFAEGFTQMLWEQRFRDQKNNKTFKAIHLRMMFKTNEIREYLKREEGELKDKDIRQIKAAVEKMRVKFLDNGLYFIPMMAVSFVIDMVVYQLKFITNGEKRRMFENLLTRIREYERYFDRDKRYEGEEGLLAAEEVRRRMGA